jgi:hypothetical protein
LLGISIAIFFVFYIAMHLIYRPTGNKLQSRKLVFEGMRVALPLGFLGLVAGFLTGASRLPAVSAVVPAILTFLGVVIVYMIGKGSLRSVVTGFAVVVFAFELVLGVLIGASSRDQRDEALESVSYQKMKADQEFAIRLYRSALGLPLESSKEKPESSKEKTE